MKSNISENIERNYSKIDDKAVAEAYVWATNENSRRQGMSAYIIQSIAQRHGGNADIDFFRHSLNINVPNEKKIECMKEIQEKIDMSLN